MVEKSKRLVLKKAYFDEGFNGSMEQIVSGVSQKLPNHEERIFNPELFKSHLVAKIENGPDGKGLFVQIFEYEKGATGLINLENSLTTAELEELLPPEKR